MKNSQKYVILIIVFISLIASITFTYLYIHYKDQGTGTFYKKYSLIKFSNINMNSEADLSVKANDDNKSIHIEIPDLSKKEFEINIDATNIGNNDLISDNYTITNVVSNVSDYVNVTSSLEKGDVIKGGDSKKIVIRIKYNGVIKGEIPYFNFNINYSFKEQAL